MRIFQLTHKLKSPIEPKCVHTYLVCELFFVQSGQKVDCLAWGLIYRGDRVPVVDFIVTFNFAKEVTIRVGVADVNNVPNDIIGEEHRPIPLFGFHFRSH